MLNYVSLTLLSSLVWSSIAAPAALSNGPSSIVWGPCDIDFGLYSSLINETLFDCATLMVPLDYTNENSAPLSLQLMKRNATKGPSKGSVLMNPGGPGGSGLEDLGIASDLYQSILGGNYDLVAFDPRGTGETIPFYCQVSNETNSSTPTRRSLLPERDLQEFLFAKGWESVSRFDERCYALQNETGSFLSTAFVARDMIQIVDALNEDGMLRYWGLSYGTLLGATVASMFPERIDRMLLDAVVNPLDYMAGYWLTASADSDKTLLGFLSECVSAGPEKCVIANFSGPATTPEDLLSTMNVMFQHLLDEPLYLPLNSTPSTWESKPFSVYEYLKQVLFSSLYSPSTWFILASTLELPLALNFTTFTTLDISDVPLDRHNKGVDALHGIACSDASYRAAKPEDMLWLVDAQQNVSSFDDILMPNLWPCYQWRMPAAERYEGNFTASTSYPVLIVNGQYDPITPVASAFNLSSGLQGSVVLQHTGYGHGFWGDPNLCVAKAVRDYFVDGVMPAPDTVCEREIAPFDIPLTGLYNGSYYDSLGRRALELSEDDQELLSIMYEVAQRKAKVPKDTFLGVGGLI